MQTKEGDLTLPAVYHASDDAAVRQQKRHFQWLRAELMALLVAAGAAAVGSVLLDMTPDTRRILAGVVLALLIASIFFRLWRRSQKYEERWFKSRALAESVKSESWLYAMKATPYENPEAKRVFGQRVGIIIRINEEALAALAESPPHGAAQITASMDAPRTRSVAERIKIYRDNRSREQSEWYKRRGGQHDRDGKKWFWIGSVLEFAAILFSVGAATFGLGLELLGFLTTASIAAVAWLQSRDFRRLATTYAFVSHDLMRLESEFGAIESEESLSAYVIEVERTLSREHAHWLSRRAGT